MKKIKVLFFLGGSVGKASTRVRVYQFLNFLEENGVKCDLITFRPKKSNIKLLRNARDLFEIIRVFRYDVVFLQKHLFPKKQFDLLKRLNNRIIFDLDDAWFAFPKEKVGREKFDLKLFDYHLKESKKVIVSNDFLADYVKKINPEISVIPSTIDTKKSGLKTENDQQKIILGYTCHPNNLKYLNMIKNTLSRVSTEHENVFLKITSSKTFNLPEVKTIFKPFKIEDHVKTLQSFDIGLMPYPNEDWFKGKAGYKGLECMGVGIPVVASPIGVIPSIIKDGVNGYLASFEEEWYRKLTNLILNRELRLEMGKKARKTVEESYSVEVWAPRLLTILRETAKEY